MTTVHHFCSFRCFGIGIATAALLATASTESASGAALLVDPVGFGPASSSGWLASAVAGYNWQRGSLVFGFEGDISWVGLKSDTSGSFVPRTTTAYVYPSEVTSANIDWYGTVRGRLGWTHGAFLFYGTGGLAYGNVDLTNKFDLGTAGQNTGIGPVITQSSGVRFGWVAGVGADYMLRPNLILNFEYRYVDLGTVSVPATAAPSPLQALVSSSASVHAQFQAVTIGLSYKLGAPSGPSAAYASMRGHTSAPLPPSDPWQGLYLGGRTGGAWGNNLSVTTPSGYRPPA